MDVNLPSNMMAGDSLMEGEGWGAERGRCMSQGQQRNGSSPPSQASCRHTPARSRRANEPEQRFIFEHDQSGNTRVHIDLSSLIDRRPWP